LWGAVAKVLTMCCFSSRYKYGVGSYSKRKKIFSFFKFVEGGAYRF
jgi:hypothetical protein